MSNLDGTSVLVTGGQGFLGEFVTAGFESAGAKVASISRRTGYDLRNIEDVVRAFLRFNPNVVVHLATAKGIPPSEILSRNLDMSMNVLKVSALSGARFMFVAGHLRCGDLHPLGIAETTLLKMCQVYQKDYSFSSSFFIAEQLYGVGADLYGLLPLVGRALHAAKKESLEKVEFTLNAEFPVPLLHAYDVSKAIVGVAERGCKDPVGTHHTVSLPSKEPKMTFSEIVERLKSKVGYEGVVGYPGGPVESLEPLKGDEADRLLGWQPEVTVDMGVEETVEWLSRGNSK